MYVYFILFCALPGWRRGVCYMCVLLCMCPTTMCTAWRTYADVCWCMLTYADVCLLCMCPTTMCTAWRMLLLKMCAPATICVLTMCPTTLLGGQVSAIYVCTIYVLYMCAATRYVCSCYYAPLLCVVLLYRSKDSCAHIAITKPANGKHN
jgi:hypothetical protein